MFVWALMLMSACPSLISIKSFHLLQYFGVFFGNMSSAGCPNWIQNTKSVDLRAAQDEQKSISFGFCFLKNCCVSRGRARREGVYFLGVPLSSGWFAVIMRVKVVFWKETWLDFPLLHLGFTPTISNHLISYLFFLCPFFPTPPHLSSSARTHLLASFLCFREILHINVVFFLDCVALCSFWLFLLSPTWAISPFSLI